METFQARLVRGNEIVGFLRILNSEVEGREFDPPEWRFWDTMAAGDNSYEIFITHDSLEPLAPFADKETKAEIYAGDIVSAFHKICNKEIKGELVYYDFAGWQINQDGKCFSILSCTNFTKLGTIHD